MEVLLLCPAIDQDVLIKHSHEPLQLPPKDVVHARMKCGGSIGQPKWHDQKLKVPIVATKCCLWDVLIPNSDLVVPRTQIDLREVLGSSKLIHQLINAGNGVPVHEGLLVKGSVVYAHPKGPILLLHQHYGRSKWTGTRPDVTQSKQLLNSLLYLILIGFGVPVRSSDDCLYTQL